MTQSAIILASYAELVASHYVTVALFSLILMVTMIRGIVDIEKIDDATINKALMMSGVIALSWPLSYPILISAVALIGIYQALALVTRSIAVSLEAFKP